MISINTSLLHSNDGLVCLADPSLPHGVPVPIEAIPAGQQALAELVGVQAQVFTIVQPFSCIICLNDSHLSFKQSAPTPILEHSPIQHAHDRKRSTHGGAYAREEVSPSPPVLLKLHVQCANLVKEEDAR